MRGDEARSTADLPQKNPLDSEADIGIGRQLFLGRCALCHGQDGEGGRGAALNTGQFRHGTSDREMFMTIRNGIANTEMPGHVSDGPGSLAAGGIRQAAGIDTGAGGEGIGRSAGGARDL